MNRPISRLCTNVPRWLRPCPSGACSLRDQWPRLHEALQRRHGVLDTQARHAGGEPPTHWLSLAGLLERNHECLLLLDGHNVLFALEEMVACFESGKPGGKARDRLIAVIRRLVDTRPQIQARIVFDAPEEALETVSHNLKVQFSGGGRGDNRADNAIVRCLTQEKENLQEPTLRTFIVTNDRSLQTRIRHQHAHYVPVWAFDEMLHHFKCFD